MVDTVQQVPLDRSLCFSTGQLGKRDRVSTCRHGEEP